MSIKKPIWNDVTATFSMVSSDNSIITSELQDQSVTTSKISDLAVTTAKISDASITQAKLDPAATLPPGDGSVTTVKLSDLAVTTAKISDLSITTAKISDDSITQAKLVDNSVGTAELIDANVTTAKLSDSTVTTAKITDLAVTTAKISDTSITSAKMGLDSALQIPEIATPSTPVSGQGKVYFKSDGKLYQLNDAGTESAVGAGSGGVENLITLDSTYTAANPDNAGAEASIGSWLAYDDTTAAPVDLTGGSPAITVTRNTGADRLNGAGSIALNSTGTSSKEGEGASCLFSVPPWHRSRTVEVTAKYDFTSFSAGTLSLAAGNYRLFFYDVTNSALITEVTHLSEITQETGGGLLSRVTIPATCASMRIGVHIATTSAVDFTLLMDDFVITPKLSVVGMAGNDTTSATMTYDGLGTIASQSVSTWRVGDRQHFEGKVVSGTVAAADIAVVLPSGMVLDTGVAKLGSTQKKVGTVTRLQSASTAMAGSSSGPWDLFYDGSTTTKLFVGVNTTTVAYTKAVGNVALSSSDALEFKFDVPISGWSSNVTMASDPSAIAVEATYVNTTDQVVTSAAIINFDTKVTDTHNAVTTGASWKFTAPVAGKYKVSWVLFATGVTDYASNGFSVSARKNGTQTRTGLAAFTGAANQMWSTATVDFDLVIGDYLDIYNATAHAAGTLNSGSGARSYVSISRIPGSTSIAIDGPRSEVRLHTSSAVGATGNRVLVFTTAVTTGDGATGTNDATNGSYITINKAGVWAFTASTQLTGATQWGIGLNGSTTTSWTALTEPQQVAGSTNIANLADACAGTRICAVGDVARVHTDGTVGSGDKINKLTATWVSH